MSEEKQFKSPLVSCICCREVKSVKGIFSHFLIAHTEEGKARAKENGKKAIPKSRENSIRKKNLAIDSYTPSKCPHCLKSLSYENRHNKFCSQSCSGSFNNSVRNNIHTVSRPKPKRKGKSCAISFCVVCNNLIKSHRKTCSDECLTNHLSLTKKKNRKGRWNTNAQWYISPIAGRVFLESGWEIEVAKQLDNANVKWIRPPYLNYTLNGIRKSYYPDFYLTDFDVYLDPKNPYQQKIDKPKLDAVILEHNIKLLILGNTELSWDIIRSMI